MTKSIKVFYKTPYWSQSSDGRLVFGENVESQVFYDVESYDFNGHFCYIKIKDKSYHFNKNNVISFEIERCQS